MLRKTWQLPPQPRRSHLARFHRLLARVSAPGGLELLPKEEERKKKKSTAAAPHKSCLLCTRGGWTLWGEKKDVQFTHSGGVKLHCQVIKQQRLYITFRGQESDLNSLVGAVSHFISRYKFTHQAKSSQPLGSSCSSPDIHSDANTKQILQKTLCGELEVAQCVLINIQLHPYRNWNLRRPSNIPRRFHPGFFGRKGNFSRNCVEVIQS